MPTPKIDEIRRSNGRKLIDQHTATKIAKLLGHQSASTLSQVFGPGQFRAPSEKMMRRIEAALDLPIGSTDLETASAVTPDITELVVSVIHLVGAVLESEAMSLSPAKFAEVVVLTFRDAMEHEGQLNEDRLRRVIRLLKPS